MGAGVKRSIRGPGKRAHKSGAAIREGKSSKQERADNLSGSADKARPIRAPTPPLQKLVVMPDKGIPIPKAQAKLARTEAGVRARVMELGDSYFYTSEGEADRLRYALIAGGFHVTKRRMTQPGKEGWRIWKGELRKGEKDGS